jgi:hypothetical protein
MSDDAGHAGAGVEDDHPQGRGTAEAAGEGGDDVSGAIDAGSPTRGPEAGPSAKLKGRQEPRPRAMPQQGSIPGRAAEGEGGDGVVDVVNGGSSAQNPSHQAMGGQDPRPKEANINNGPRPPPPHIERRRSRR